MIWGILWQIGDQVSVPAAGGDGGKDLDYLDMRDLRERAWQVENNARAALLVAITEADEE